MARGRLDSASNKCSAASPSTARFHGSSGLVPSLLVSGAPAPAPGPFWTFLRRPLPLARFATALSEARPRAATSLMKAAACGMMHRRSPSRPWPTLRHSPCRNTRGPVCAAASALAARDARDALVGRREDDAPGPGRCGFVAASFFASFARRCRALSRARPEAPRVRCTQSAEHDTRGVRAPGWITSFCCDCRDRWTRRRRSTRGASCGRARCPPASPAAGASAVHASSFASDAEKTSFGWRSTASRRPRLSLATRSP